MLFFFSSWKVKRKKCMLIMNCTNTNWKSSHSSLHNFHEYVFQGRVDRVWSAGCILWEKLWNYLWDFWPVLPWAKQLWKRCKSLQQTLGCAAAPRNIRCTENIWNPGKGGNLSGVFIRCYHPTCLRNLMSWVIALTTHIIYPVSSLWKRMLQLGVITSLVKISFGTKSQM